MLAVAADPTKRCAHCGEIKPLEEFRGRSDRINQRHSWCKPCLRAYERGRPRKRTHDHHRDKSYKRKYGITLDDYNRMFTEQGGVCCICGETESGNPYGVLEVEHCHKTGKVRGLVCHPCNTAISWCENLDSYEYGDKVMAFIRRFKD